MSIIYFVEVKTDGLKLLNELFNPKLILLRSRKVLTESVIGLRNKLDKSQHQLQVLQSANKISCSLLPKLLYLCVSIVFLLYKLLWFHCFARQI